MKKYLIALVVILLSGLAYYFASPFHNIWWLMWLMPIPVLIYVYHHNFWHSLLVSFMIGLAPGIDTIIGYWSTPIPIQAFLLEGLLQSLEWTIVILLTRYLTRKNQAAYSIFIYPCVLAIVEYLVSLTEQGIFNTIAYSQLSVLPILQIASITGFIGITFIVSLFSSCVAYSIIFYQQKISVLIAIITTIIILAISLGFGFYHLNQQKMLNQQSVSVKVGLVSIDMAPKNIFNPENAAKIAEQYNNAVQRLATQGAQIILLPEEILAINKNNSSEILAIFSKVAKDNHIIVIVGVNETIGEKHFNTALLFNQNGQLVGKYLKRHFVPIVEDDLTPGSELVNFLINNQKAGIAICRDMDYPNPAHQYGKNNSGVLFVPAWDFSVDEKVHAMGAFLNGIQNGYTIVRSARAGLLSVTDPVGNTTEISTNLQPVTTLSTIAIIANQTSFYARHGNWFVWLLFIVLILIFGDGLVSSKR